MLKIKATAASQYDNGLPTVDIQGVSKDLFDI